MAGSAYYSTGTASIIEGERIVTGLGTGWLTREGGEGSGLSPIKAGDKFGIHVGRPILIESVDSNTQITLADPWPGPSQEAAPYKVELTSPQIIAIDAMRRLFASLSSGNLTSLASLQLDDQQIPIAIGPGVFGTIAKDDLVQAVKFDAEVPTLADRAAYDGAAKGFRVLVSDIGDGRSAFYTKRSATAADWSPPFYVSGTQGETGPLTELTFGPVTTLPSGQPASVNVVQVDADTVRLDLSLPKGQDGNGTGDVEGPDGGVASGDIAAFDSATGKLIRKATTAELKSAIGGLPIAGYISPGFNLSNNGDDTANDINYPTGIVASDHASPILMSHAAGTAQLDVAYGTGNGGRFDASISDGTWHCFVISNGTTVSRGFSKSLDPTTEPNYPSGYTHYRRVASWLRDGGALRIIRQRGDEFRFESSIQNRNSTTAVSNALISLGVPTGIVVQPILMQSLVTGDGGFLYAQLGDGDRATAHYIFGRADNGGNVISGVRLAYTNTSAQVRYTLSAAATVIEAALYTQGFIDTRGRL